MSSNHFPTAIMELRQLLNRAIVKYNALTNRISPQHWRVTGHHITELKQMLKGMQDFTEITDEERLHVAEFLDPEFRMGEQVIVTRDDDDDDVKLKNRIQVMLFKYPFSEYQKCRISDMYCHKSIDIKFNTRTTLHYERGEVYPIYLTSYYRLIELLVDGSITPNVPTEDKSSTSNPLDEVPMQYQRITEKSPTHRLVISDQKVIDVWTDEYVEWLENQLYTLSKRKS